MDMPTNTTAPAADDVTTVPAGTPPAAPETQGESSGGAQGQEQNAPAAGHWAAALGDADMAAALQGFATPQDALAVLKRGQDYQPVLKADDLKLTCPEGMVMDPEVEAGLKNFSVQHGLTAAQAQELVNWHTGLMSARTKAYIENGTSQLKQKWGPAFDANVGKALGFLNTVDKRMEGRLSANLNASGMNNDPVMIEALHLLSTVIAEDSVGNGAGAPAQSGPEKPVDAFKGMFH